MEQEQIHHLFTYHAPTADKAKQYEEVRRAALQLALAIHRLTPTSPDQSVAIRCVREAVMWANSAIANDGRG